MSLNMKEVTFNTLNAHFFHLGRWIKLKSHYSLLKIIGSMVSQKYSEEIRMPFKLL